jgi:hypothetical protein
MIIPHLTLAFVPGKEAWILTGRQRLKSLIPKCVLSRGPWFYAHIVVRTRWLVNGPSP